MSEFLKRANSFAKDFLLASRLGYLVKPFANLNRFSSNFALLTAWIQKHKDEPGFNDFYKPRRVYTDREKMFQFISEQKNLAGRKIHYLEFGVAEGTSFRWWINHNKNPESSFWGFDTFEGLPESWFYYKKGAMTAGGNLPAINDQRGQFLKGLFQDTLVPFLREYKDEPDTLRILHLDADLYSSTLFALTMLAPFLRPGDLLFFDEFNVPNHEFAAWNDFIRSYYFEYKVVGAANNFYQTAMELTKTFLK